LSSRLIYFFFACTCIFSFLLFPDIIWTHWNTWVRSHDDKKIVYFYNNDYHRITECSGLEGTSVGHLACHSTIEFAWVIGQE